MELLYVILFGAVAGIIGTTIGGVISAFLSKKDNVISVLFCIAAGVMLAIVCFDLIPEAYRMSGNSLLSVGLSILAGGILVVVLDEIIKYMAPKIKKPVEDRLEGANFCACDENLSKRRSEMIKAGVLMMLAIAMHNLPEGIVIGSSTVENKGVLMMILIGLHNIPEGIAVAAPLVAGGVKKGKAIAITAATGLPTLFGAIIGYYIGLESQIFISISLGIAAGAMMCIIFSDMIPEAQKMYDSKVAGYATFISVLIGAILIYAFV